MEEVIRNLQKKKYESLTNCRNYERKSKERAAYWRGYYEAMLESIEICKRKAEK